MTEEKNVLTSKAILVADDIEINRSIVKKVFGASYTVFQAQNGIEALNVLRENVIDIVLLDIQMPVMDGYEVIAEMKKDARLCDIPIVVTTGAVDKSERRAFDMGADDYITQPYDPYIMKKRVENLIDRYELHGIRSVMKEQKRFRDLFDILGIAYWEWTKAGGYYYSEKYSQYAVSKLEPDKIWSPVEPYKYVHPDDVDIMKSFMALNSKGTEKRSAIVRCLMLDGSYRWTEMFSISEHATDGELSRLVTVMRDVDKEWLIQKEQLQEALKEAQSANVAKTAFLSRISHDMRTPLNGILGLTTLLKENITDRKVSRDLTELEMSASYLLNLVNDTLDMNKIECHKFDLHPVVFDGRTAFNNIISLAKTGMNGKRINLHIDADNVSFYMVYADLGRIQQVILNVFGNAVKFTPEGGDIFVTSENLSVENGVLTNKFTIRDTGVGMKQEFLPHIFEPFSQEDTSRTSSYQGTGLGMAITKQILDAMNSEINVSSEIGKGSCFTIKFRMNIATDEQIENWKQNRINIDNRAGLVGKRILLCEDHPLNAKIAERLLTAKGMIVERAENGREGVDMFSSSEEKYYDAVLMDIRMPIMDGIDAAKAIRSLSRNDSSSVPIIAMTANAFSDDIEQTKKAGMNAHLSKPIQTDLLYNTLSELLNIRQDASRQKILIVDDIEINRAVIRSTLEGDYDILEASNGVEAMKIIDNSHGLDAVITDIQMPVMNGTELIKKIRSNPAYNHMVIIANTQFGDPMQEEKLLAIGANDFVYKPTTPKIVEIRVRNVLKRI